MILYIYGCAGSLLLPTCFFLVAPSRGLLSSCSHGLFIVVASLVPEHRLQGLWASVVAAYRLSSSGSQVQQLWCTGFSCSEECDLFLDQWSNLCLLHWQADSLPLSHQGSPKYQFLAHKKVKRLFAPTSNTPKHRLTVRFKYVIYEIISHTFNYAL